MRSIENGAGDHNAAPSEIDRTPPGDPPAFDPARCVAYRVECRPGRWIVGFHGVDDRGEPCHHAVDGDLDRLRAFLRRLREKGRTLVGYDSTRRDAPLLAAILDGRDPYPLSQAPDGAKGSRPPVVSLPCDHIDLMARVVVGRHRPSLPEVAARFGWASIRERPQQPEVAPDDEGWAEVLRHNRLALEHTRALLLHFADELRALDRLSHESGRDLRSTPSPRVVEAILGEAYRKSLGADPPRLAPPEEVTYRPVDGVRRPSNPDAAAWYDRITGAPMVATTSGGKPVFRAPEARFRIGRLELKVGSGGIHSQHKASAARIHHSGKGSRIVSVDVAGFYPSIIAGKGIAFRAHGEAGLATFRGFLARRIDLKARARGEAGGPGRDALKVEATALKLVLNAAFGKLGDPYSDLYDPEAMLRVTLSGQLLIIDLVERLTAAGAEVLFVNTDGIVLRHRRGDLRWKLALDGWERDTGLALDVEPLLRLLILSTNHYATLGRGGRVKRAGDGLKGSMTHLTTPNELVVADAVADALLSDVPPERTIRACRDPARFCRVARATEDRPSVLVEEDGSEVDLPGVFRWYKARDRTRRLPSSAAIFRTSPAAGGGSGRRVKQPGGGQAALALELTPGVIPGDLDHSWYIARASQVVLGVRGHRNRDPRLLQGHGPALEVLGRGLVPAPKWKGKAQGAGSQAARPTFLHDWSRYPTAGTYTGISVGILVADVDEPVLFRRLVDGYGTPSKRGRREDLDGCLVSCRGEATPDGVRAGSDRGKLIFRVEDDDILACVGQNDWKKYGVEVFYGSGMPSVLGPDPDGGEYRLDGTLGPAPPWLIAELTRRAERRPRRARGVEADRFEIPEGMWGELEQALAGLSPKLGRDSAGWRLKDLAEGWSILVGTCPFQHTSGRSNDGDLSAGFNQEGRPYVECEHKSCSSVREINARLKESGLRAVPPPEQEVPPPPPDGAPAAVPYVRAEPDPIPGEEGLPEPTPMALIFSRDLADGMVSRNGAPTGSGKTYSAALTAAHRLRLGLPTLIAEPTILLADEVVKLLRRFTPDAFQAEAIAEVYGRHRPVLAEDAHDDEESETESDGDYPIHGHTLIVVCTHAQLGRRGFSRYMRGIWARLGPDPKTGRPAFTIVIDEYSELIRLDRWDEPLCHRTYRKDEPDSSGGVFLPKDKCPKSNRSGNCGNCTLVHHGGSPRFNRFGIREVGKPQPIEFDRDGTPLRRPRNPLVVFEDLILGEKIRVGETTFAAQLIGYRGRRFGPNDRKFAALETFKKGKEGDTSQPHEANGENIGHLLSLSYNPVVTWEHPINEAGEIVLSETLAARAQDKDKKWDENILFPRDTCEVPRLQFMDMACLENLARHAQREGVGIILTGATASPDDDPVLRVAWPRMIVRDHPYPDRRIKQVAIIAPEGFHGIGSLVGKDKRLVTATLEEAIAGSGLGVVFCATRTLAESLYDGVCKYHHSTRLAVENDEKYSQYGFNQQEEPKRTLIAYSRGVLGVGANILGIRFLVVDAHAYRAIAGFNPGEVSPEEFERLRTAERLSLILQNIGRALRGEEGKTVALFVLNADDDLLAAIRTSPAILEGSELPPIAVTGKDLPTLVDQAGRWLARGGGDWPDPDPTKAGPKPGRPKKDGLTAARREKIARLADDAISAGVGWREFSRKHNLNRDLSKPELGRLAARFGVIRNSS